MLFKSFVLSTILQKERVALMQEYNALLTKDEDQAQVAILVVNKRHKLYPDSNKATVLLASASYQTAGTGLK